MEEAVKNVDPPVGHKRNFTGRVWVVVAVTALVVAVLWILKAAFSVLLLILAGALIALYFRGLAHLLQRNLHLSQTASLLLSVIGSLLLLLLFFWFAGNRIAQQADELSKTLPSTVQNAKQQLGQTGLGGQIIERLSAGGGSQKTSPFLKNFFQTTFGVLGDLYVVLFLGIFFTAAPKVYTDGVVTLVPARGRKEAANLLRELGTTLTKWLKGQLLAMLIVAVFTFIGLLALGIPMAFVLALVAGILNFIPNFGPLIALVPAVLIGLMEGPTKALLVAGLYILIQVLESNVITPQIQKRMIDIPPALIIISQLFMGVLTGGWGLVLATPLVAILMVVVRELWVKKQDAQMLLRQR